MSAEAWHIMGQVIGGLFMTFGIIVVCFLCLGWLLKPTIEEEAAPKIPALPLPPPVDDRPPQMASTTTMTITTKRWAVPAGYVIAAVPPAGPQASPVLFQQRSGGDPRSEESLAGPEPRTS